MVPSSSLVWIRHDRLLNDQLHLVHHEEMVHHEEKRKEEVRWILAMRGSKVIKPTPCNLMMYLLPIAWQCVQAVLILLQAQYHHRRG
jgi:hypothetical protein